MEECWIFFVFQNRDIPFLPNSLQMKLSVHSSVTVIVFNAQRILIKILILIFAGKLLSIWIILTFQSKCNLNWTSIIYIYYLRNVIWMLYGRSVYFKGSLWNYSWNETANIFGQRNILIWFFTLFRNLAMWMWTIIDLIVTKSVQCLLYRNLVNLKLIL